MVLHRSDREVLLLPPPPPRCYYSTARVSGECEVGVYLAGSTCDNGKADGSMTTRAVALGSRGTESVS